MWSYMHTNYRVNVHLVVTLVTERHFKRFHLSTGASSGVFDEKMRGDFIQVYFTFRSDC